MAGGTKVETKPNGDQTVYAGMNCGGELDRDQDLGAAWVEIPRPAVYYRGSRGKEN